MPYAFREMIQDHLELVFGCLIPTSTYPYLKGHIALLLGRIAFVAPHVKKRDILGPRSLKKAADLERIIDMPLLDSEKGIGCFQSFIPKDMIISELLQLLPAIVPAG